MGLNLDLEELNVVKQVCIVQNNVTKDRAQAHISELEEEVKLLQNLSHPNIVRYLGTAGGGVGAECIDINWSSRYREVAGGPSIPASSDVFFVVHTQLSIQFWGLCLTRAILI
jgi:hypothetical protein